MTANEFYRALQAHLQKEDNGLKQKLKDKLALLREEDIEIGEYPTFSGYAFEYTAKAYGYYYANESYRFPITGTFTSPGFKFYNGDEKAAIKHVEWQVTPDFGSYDNYVKQTGFVMYPYGWWEDAIESDATMKLREEFKKLRAALCWNVPREVLEYTQKPVFDEYQGKYAPVFGRVHNDDGTVETLRLGYVFNDNGTDYMKNVMGEEKVVLDFTQDKEEKTKSSGVPMWVWIVGGVGLFIIPPVGIGFLAYGIVRSLMG